MINPKVHHSSVYAAIRSKPSGKAGCSSLVARILVLIAFLFFAGSIRAQTPALKFTFEDAPGLTTANSGSATVSLSMFNAANAATDLHGPVGSGVLGQINGN